MMGAKLSKKHPSAHSYNKMNPKTKKLYYTAEFQCMGDVLKDDRLNEREFSRLMVLLGLPEADKWVPVLWKKQKKADGNKMSLDEYCNLMADSSTDLKTSMWRKLFAQFDHDGSGWASHGDVIKGLEEMGIKVDEAMRKKISDMDPNKDGRIHYGDFLKMQLLEK